MGTFKCLYKIQNIQILVDLFTKNHKSQPHGGTTGTVRGSLKSLGFIVWEALMFVCISWQSIQILLIKIFQSQWAWGWIPQTGWGCWKILRWTHGICWLWQTCNILPASSLTIQYVMIIMIIDFGANLLVAKFPDIHCKTTYTECKLLSIICHEWSNAM